MNYRTLGDMLSQPATLVRRAEAGITTAVPVIVFSAVALWAINTVFPLDMYLRHYGFSAGQSEALAMTAVLSLPFLWMIVDGGIAKATYGMRKCNVRFGHADGTQIGLARCLVRLAAGIILLPLFPVSWIIALIDGQHRTLADHICKTAVWADRPGKEPKANR